MSKLCMNTITTSQTQNQQVDQLVNNNHDDAYINIKKKKQKNKYLKKVKDHSKIWTSNKVNVRIVNIEFLPR